MPPEQIIDKKLAELRGRIRLLNALHWSCMLAFYVSLVGLAVLAASKFHWVEVFPEAVAGTIVAAAVLGAFVGLLRRVTPMETARRTDSRLGLKERLSSALEFRTAGLNHPLVSLQIADAAVHSEAIEPKSAYPARCPREGKLLGISLVAIILLLVVPELSVFQSPQVRAERASIRKQGEQIVRVSKEVQKRANAGNLDLSKRIARNMELLGKDMMRNRVSKKQALLKMHKLTKEMAEAQRKLQDPRATKQALGDMKKLADKMPDDFRKTEAGKLLQQMADAAAKGDYKKAQEMAKRLAERAASGKMSPEEKKKTAEQLSKMAKGLQSGALGNAMKKAADAAAKGDAKEASKQMAKAMQAAEKADKKSSESKSLEKMTQAVQQSQQQMQKSGYG